ncbi:MAG: filamentous hemagglutinin, partial [Verrucomicrobiota bacterium]
IKAESTTGNGGNITIDPTFVVLNTSSLIANAITGNGGKITIDSHYFFVSDSLIDASSQFGVQGSIFITALNFDVTGNLLTLPGNPLDAEARLRPHCAIRLPHGASSFTVTGRSQLPAEPDGLLPAFP